jgi:hypothetical protein
MHRVDGFRFRRPALRLVCSALLILASLPDGTAQLYRNWWTINAEREDTEKGRLQELFSRKKVWISVTFSDTRPNSSLNSPERNDILQAVKEALSVQKDLRMVTYPEEADFALLVRASTRQGEGDRGPNFSLLLDAEAEVSIEVLVVIPGSRQADGSRLPRVVWEASTPNAQVEAASAARFTVDGFLWEWKKFRDRK